jgi:hypothetical protein
MVSIFAVVCWFTCAILCGIAAKTTDRSQTVWTCIGMATGVIGLVAILLLANWDHNREGY